MGSVGLYAVLGDAHNVAPYYFPALIGQIKARLPADASVSRVSEIVKEEVEKFSSWFDVYLKRGLLQQEDSPGDYPLEYLIAGYQAGVPTIYSIYVEVDWQQLHLKGIQRVLMHPERNGQEDFAIYGVGSKRVLQELKQEQGDLYQRVISKAPSESRMLSGKRELSINQASNLVRALLEVEAEANPEQVGPPFTIVTIPKNGPPLISSIDAHAHPEPGPLHNNESCLESANPLPLKDWSVSKQFCCLSAFLWSHFAAQIVAYFSHTPLRILD